MLSQAPQLSPPASIKQMFTPSRGMKPFRLELPLEEQNPISQSLLTPQESTLHPTVHSLAVLHSQGSKKHLSCQIKAEEMVSPIHLPQKFHRALCGCLRWLNTFGRVSQNTLGINQIWGAAFPPCISPTPLHPPGCSQSSWALAMSNRRETHKPKRKEKKNEQQ